MNTVVSPFERVRVKPVAEAIERNSVALGRIVNTGMSHELATFPVMELPSPVSFRRAGVARRFTHVLPVAYAVGGDFPDKSRLRGAPVEVYPQLSMRLQEGQVATSGLIAKIHFAELSIPEEDFLANDGPDISGLLTPETFDVQRGDHFTEENYVYGGDRDLSIGGNSDRGDLARLTAMALDATATLLSGHSQEQLDQLASSSNPLS
jgi:hypothetical protein